MAWAAAAAVQIVAAAATLTVVEVAVEAAVEAAMEAAVEVAEAAATESWLKLWQSASMAKCVAWMDGHIEWPAHGGASGAGSLALTRWWHVKP